MGGILLWEFYTLVDRDGGGVTVVFVWLETLWMESTSELQMAKVYCVGRFVRLKANVVTPRFEWPCKRGGWAGVLLWVSLGGLCLEMNPIASWQIQLKWNKCLLILVPYMLRFFTGLQGPLQLH
ncbi:hypothetical protein P3X46_010854 [Hevea brasiliensis]|uniref:Uncharacterized protein n=1 Tax=Hevea brasiliensis TaxID=3981 RepID=A0ABQ9MHE0_HEVBR|nr:hypothetical protein P3X46_010854 [Hevea brasiliensis]